MSLSSKSKQYTLHAWQDNRIRLKATQGEGGIKIAQFILVDDNGAIDLTTATSVTFDGIKRNGTGCCVDCSIVNATKGIVDFTEQTGITDIGGNVKGTINVVTPEGNIKFDGITLYVAPNNTENLIEASTAFSALTKALNKVAVITPEGTIEMDDTLSTESANPVQNKIITAIINDILTKKIDKGSTLSDYGITDAVKSETFDEKTDFISVTYSENRLDVNDKDVKRATSPQNSYKINADGSVGTFNATNNVAYSVSGFIPVEPEKIYILKAYNTGTKGYETKTAYNAAVYDKNRNFIRKYSNYSQNFEIPTNGAYIRVVIADVLFSDERKAMLLSENYITSVGTVKDHIEFSKKTILNALLSKEENPNEPPDDTKIDMSKVKIIAGDKIYLVNDEPLRIYKSSICNSDKVKLYLQSKFDFYNDETALPYFSELSGMVEVKANEISDSLELKILDDIGNVYNRTLTVEKVKTADISNKSVKLSCFGDSTMYGGLLRPCRKNLVRFGFTPSFIGTNKTGTTEMAEARSSYCYAHYIGYRTVLSADKTQEAPPLPFLKIASAEDKVNHPDWCYTRTLSENEKTYSEVVSENGDTTQDFYIFDYARYLSENSLDTPDIAIIGMGINDSWKYPQNWISICKKAITIMVTQMRKAVPNLKIGITCMPIKNTNESQERQAEFTEMLRELSKNLDFDIISEHISQSKEFDFNYSEGEEKNGYSQITVTDKIHTGLHGYMEGGIALSYYVVNRMGKGEIANG